jgi:acyl-CoA thioesterase FadM
MARIRISLPDNQIGEIFIPVRITDINYGNHLGNDALVSILHEARVAWLRTNGYTELDVCGSSLIQGDLAVEYVNESFYGDVLRVRLSASDISRVSFDMFYHIETNRNEQTITIAKAKTGLLCYDYTKRKVIAVPGELKTLLGG